MLHIGYRSYSNGRRGGAKRLLLCLMLCSAVPASAQQTGHLRLADLLPQTHVYVDARPVTLQRGIVAVLPGWHRVQVERKGKEGLMAYRRWIQIEAGRTTDMPIIWRRVLTGGPMYATPGMPGAAGEPGPTGRAFQSLPAKGDLAALEKPLREARDILLDDLSARLQDAINATYSPEEEVYLVGVEASPPGDRGSLGPQGSPGLPSESALIQNEKGIPMDTLLARQLGLEQIEAELAAMQQRLAQIAQAEQNKTPAKVEPFRLLTPEWHVKPRPTQPKAPPQEGVIHEIPDLVGSPGAPGVRGVNGVPPAGIPALILAPPLQKQMLEGLISDKMTREKMAQIHQQLLELKQKISLAEGLHLERFPPVPR